VNAPTGEAAHYRDAYVGLAGDERSRQLAARRPQLNDPAVVGIDAQAPGSVYAVGSGNAQDEGGPTVILHYNGHSWRRVAEGSFGIGTSPLQQVSYPPW
jgi:hypothetical protein